MMKKTIVFIALGLLTLSSCVKDYTCKCTEPTGNGNKHYDFQARSKSDAEDICAAEEGQSFGYDFTCELQ